MTHPDDEAFTVSDQMWEALGVVYERHQGQAAAYVARSPQGDSAISRRTAKALASRGFIRIDIMGQRAWLTPGGKTAYESHLRTARSTT